MKLIFNFLLIFAFQAIASDKEVVIAATEYPPITSIKLENYGYLTDIIIQAFEEVGYKVNIKFYPWTRALKTAQEGKVDGILAWHTKQREQWFYFSKPLPSQIVGFYKRTIDKINIHDYANLSNYTIGYVRGYSIPLELNGLNLNIVHVLKDEHALLMLARSRVDLVLGDKSLAQNLISTKYPELEKTIEWIEPAVSEQVNYVAFSKKAINVESKIRDFNIGLIRLQNQINTIMKKHGY